MDHVVVVTGASGGIGRATSVALARVGAAVFLHGFRNQHALGETVKQVEDLGGRCACHFGDLREQAAQRELVDGAWKWAEQIGLDGVRGWVNLAGVDVLTGDAGDSSFGQKLKALWRMDVEATILLSREVGRLMRPKGGSIVNVGWDQAEWGMEGDSGEMFAATKGAIMAFTRSLARSLAPDVRVNCVAPGWIKTEWGQNASALWQQRAVRESLLQRWGQPSDVADAVCFLVSERAAFINGQVLHVNGGFAGHAGALDEA